MLARPDRTLRLRAHQNEPRWVNGGRRYEPSVERLYAADREALRRRMVAAGAPVGARTYSVDAPHGVFTAIDPDGNVIVVNARDSTDRVGALPAPGSSTHARTIMSVPS